jgi:hypothetical protein
MAKGPTDTGKMLINLGSFEGGQSVDFKNGVANSFLTSEALDFRSKASQMSVTPGAAALSGASAVLVDLPVEMVQDPTGTRWILGDAGNLYKLTTGGTLTKVSTLTDGTGFGMVYNQLSDMLYITGQQTVSMYGPVQGTPALKDMQFGKSASSANGVVNLYQTTTTNYDGAARNNLQSLATTQGVTAPSQVTTNTSANSYTAPTTIDETASTNKCPFAPDLEPFASIAVYVKTKGTGNLVLTLHDGFNRQLAQITILNAALTTGYNEFVFPTPGIRSFTGAIQSGLSAAYHFHMTSTVADTTLGTLTASDLSTVDFILFNYRLVETNNGWHPATIFTGNGFMLCVGNGQYLSTYNFSNDQNPSNNVWQRERFPIDAGFEICGLSVNNQYLVIAAEKRSSSSVNNYQEGFLYLWDGQNATYNFKIAIPMGSPYSIYTFNNITYFVAAGALYAFGGNPGQSVIKIRPIAYQNTDYLGMTDLTIVNPNMMAPRFNILMVGYPSKTTNVNLKYGVYTWGSVELIYPNSFGYGYALSNGVYNYSAANNLQIGMIKNFVDTMYIASRKTVSGTTTYYLDFVNNSSAPAGSFNWASLIYDGGVRYKQKEAMRYKVSFLPWPANATLTVWYALERGSQVSADPITSVSYSPTTGDTSIIIDINKRFYEAQWGLYGTCNSPVSAPTITGVTMEIDPLGSEADLRADDQAEGS